MSTLQQPCPSCGRQLELPTTAIGRLAQCPACEVTFTVESPAMGETSVEPASDVDQDPNALPGDESSIGSSTSDRDVRESTSDRNERESTSNRDERDGAETPFAPSRVSDSPSDSPNHSLGESGVEFPGDEQRNPFTSPLESGMAGQPSLNPYLPSQMAAEPVATVGVLQVVPRSVEEVFSATLAIFGARWGVLLGAFVLVLTASFAVYFVPMFVLAAIADAGGDMFGYIGLAIWVPLMVIAGCYVSVGLARNAIAVARNSPAPLSELFPPLGIVVRFLIGVVILSAVVGILAGLFAGLISLANSVGGGGVSIAVAAIGVIGGGILAMLGYWFLWGWWFVVSDGKAGAIESLKVAWAITRHNKMTSALMILIATVLSMAGASFCYVGLLATQPLTNLMFAVAYLLMTNQTLSDPRFMNPQPYPTQPVEPAT